MFTAETGRTLRMATPTVRAARKRERVGTRGGAGEPGCVNVCRARAGPHE